MNWSECVKLIKQDLARCGGGIFYSYIAYESFQVMFWFRIASYLWERKKTCFWVYEMVRLVYKHYEHKTGIQLPMGTKVGGGLLFGHYGCIVISEQSRIGRNVSIYQGVTIGRCFGGKKAGVPTIGDNVVIFAGAKIIGNVTVGDNAVIGANAVVSTDIPANSVAVGIPAKVISENSSHCFDESYGNYHVHSFVKKS